MSIIRRTLLLTLSLLVLMSSTGFSMGLHWCAGTLQDMAFFHKADTCPMEQKQQPLPCHEPVGSGHNETASSDMGCCEDNLIVVEGVDDAPATKEAVSLKNPDLQLIAILQTAFLFLQPQETAYQDIPFSYTSPPLLRDIPVLVQSFLI